jgi:nitrate reductase assembly molybdenum cofactor insertion protein NarJ
MSGAACITDTIAEAARWHLLGVLFERPRPRWRTELSALAGEVADPALRAAAELVRAGTEGAYLAALGPGGACSPREVAYCGLRDPGWVLADLARYYRAFGYGPRAEDPLDHVAVEVGFVAYLHLKEALARDGGDDDAAAVTAAARAGFVSEHLAVMAGPLARRLGASGAGHLAAAADLLAARVPASPVAEGAGAGPTDDGCGGCALP